MMPRGVGIKFVSTEGFTQKTVSKTVGTEFVSHDGFNLTNAAKCRKKFCLNDGGSPQPTVDDFVTVKASDFKKS